MGCVINSFAKTMHVSTGPQAKPLSHQPTQSLSVPSWIGPLIECQPRSYVIDAYELKIAEGDDASLVSLTLPQARILDAADLERQTIEAYQQIRTLVATLRHKYPVRFWNALPDIHQQLDAGRDRYMVFNAGRFAAFNDWFCHSGAFSSQLPAASAVGHDGDALYIHCLTLAHPGVAVENPRQIPAFRYSIAYGPQPPCFARGTIVTHPLFDGAVLITAGTASILGEESVHPNNVEMQLAESMENLRALLVHAQGPSHATATFDAFLDLRVYHTRERDAAIVEETIRRSIGSAIPLQVVRGQLCRSNLLVEIEGIALLQGSRSQ
jgi:chorismate lyase/3-hydroxybenzoate synthase